MVFSALACIFYGPSHALKIDEISGIKNNIWVVMAGLTIIAGSSSFIMLPILPEIIDIITIKY